MTEQPTHGISRAWAMPSPQTFSIKPIRELLQRWLPTDPTKIVDPFCGDTEWAGVRNDLMRDRVEANDFLDTLIAHEEKWADAVLLDPPYSPRQIVECYKKVGLSVSNTTSQNARLYKEAIDRLDRLLKPGGIAIRCGWNSVGFGKSRGYRLEEVLIVCHGGAHNDTIITVERKGDHR